MIKKVSEIQKKEILDSFINGSKIIDLSKTFNFTVPTITRQLKNILGEEKFQEIKNLKDESALCKKNTKHKSKKELLSKEKKKNKLTFSGESNINISENENQSFFEVTPLIQDLDFDIQKEITSIPISEIQLPRMVYMIVDKNTDLVFRSLNEFPEWSFLPEEDLVRKILKIYFDQKNAKRDCRKDQKVIKVPNSDVFRIAAPFLKTRGISRIISETDLISL